MVRRRKKYVTPANFIVYGPDGRNGEATACEKATEIVDEHEDALVEIRMRTPKGWKLLCRVSNK